jgi:hypothetical protein
VLHLSPRLAAVVVPAALLVLLLIVAGRAFRRVSSLALYVSETAPGTSAYLPPTPKVSSASLTPV